MIRVDELRRWGPGSPPSSHMTADSIDELERFALEVGVPSRYRHRGASFPHYDLPKKWREKALARGAVFVTAAVQARTRVAVRALAAFFRRNS